MVYFIFRINTRREVAIDNNTCFHYKIDKGHCTKFVSISSVYIHKPLYTKISFFRRTEQQLSYAFTPKNKSVKETQYFLVHNCFLYFVHIIVYECIEEFLNKKRFFENCRIGDCETDIMPYTVYCR